MWDEKRRLKEALKLNEPLATAYYLKDDLRRFWEQPGGRFATTFLDGWIRGAAASGIKVLQPMARTLAAHRSSLLAYYDVMITSGPLEGTNNQITTMKRQANGFRGLEFLRSSSGRSRRSMRRSMPWWGETRSESASAPCARGG